MEQDRRYSDEYLEALAFSSKLCADDSPELDWRVNAHDSIPDATPADRMQLSGYLDGHRVPFV